MIFSGQASDGSMYTDQGKRPDQTKSYKYKNYHSKSSAENKKERIRKRKETSG
jgi:hypothetical protein